MKHYLRQLIMQLRRVEHGSRAPKKWTGKWRRRLLMTAVVAAVGCQPHDASEPAPEHRLPIGEPVTVGLSSERLDRLAEEIEAGAHGGVHSLLVLRSGVLAYERYFDGWTARRLHEMQSISKGVVSLAVGIALDRGELAGLDQTVVDFFPEITIAHDGAWKRAITIGDILRMSSGVDYHEGERGSPHWELNRLRRGWARYWLNRPMRADPGTTWSYDSGGVIALSSVFERVTGMHVDEYASRYLFEPLGIDTYRWERNSEGEPHAGGGLHLRPRDLAKLGLLILYGGTWKGQSVVPSDWIERSTGIKASFGEIADPIMGYAYLWWVFKPDPAVPEGRPIVAGTGLGGQYLFVIPDHDMVVVVTGWSDDDAGATAPQRFLYEEVLPAVH